MIEKLNPATMGGARIIAKADKLATPNIAQTAADCDLSRESDGARFMRSPAGTSITTDGRYGLEDDPAEINMEIAEPTVNASSWAAAQIASFRASLAARVGDCVALRIEEALSDPTRRPAPCALAALRGRARR
jgi:hypothetical protein